MCVTERQREPNFYTNRVLERKMISKRKICIVLILKKNKQRQIQTNVERLPQVFKNTVFYLPNIMSYIIFQENKMFLTLTLISVVFDMSERERREREREREKERKRERVRLHTRIRYPSLYEFVYHSDSDLYQC